MLAEEPYCSIVAMSPFNIPVKGLRYFVLKAYFDGSGTIGCRFLTLAGLSATDDTWKSVEDAWLDTLHKYGLQYCHASQAWALDGPWQGWDHAQVTRLFGDLLQVISKFRHSEGKDLRAFSCTVDMVAYRKLKRSACVDITEAESICVDNCVSPHFRRRPAPSLKYLSLVFDRGEKFQQKIDRMWRAPKSKQPYWSKWIASMTTACSESTPGLQLPDLIAWITNRHYAASGSVAGLWTACMTDANPHHEYYSEAQILMEYNHPNSIIRFKPGTGPRNAWD